LRADYVIRAAPALIICTLTRLREAARHLLDRRDTTEEERRLATAAIEWLHSITEGKRCEFCFPQCLHTAMCCR